MKLVGGRLIHLRLAASKLRIGYNMEDLKEELFGLVKHELHDLAIKIRPSSKSSVLLNTTWSVAKALLDSPERKLNYSQFSDLLQGEEDNLIESTVQFQSPLVEAYFEKLTT